MRTTCLAAAVSVVVLGTVPVESHAREWRLFQGRRCEDVSATATSLVQAPQPPEEMVTITRVVPVTTYTAVTSTETYTYTVYVCQPDGRVVPETRTGERTVTRWVPRTETRTERVEVPASSPAGLRFTLLQVQDDLKKLTEKVGPRAEETKPIQKQIDDLKEKLSTKPDR